MIEAAPINFSLPQRSFGNAGLSAGHTSPAGLAVPLAGAGPRPLLPVGGVVSLLGCNADRVLDLINSGELLWAFDLSLLHGKGSALDLRVPLQCVESFNEAAACAIDLAGIVRSIIPQSPTDTTAVSEAALGLNCSPTHLYALISRGEISSTGIARRGRGGSARVYTSSLLVFLRRRRYPFADEDQPR
ncbi:MAG TPA: helix-turn-helix domain-containing protein [Verrucomicrobiae bacterium]|nr:helix-turn-helix domain-containing protein [Verrucomicrobiae bacterium]